MLAGGGGGEFPPKHDNLSYENRRFDDFFVNPVTPQVGEPRIHKKVVEIMISIR